MHVTLFCFVCVVSCRVHAVSLYGVCVCVCLCVCVCVCVHVSCMFMWSMVCMCVMLFLFPWFKREKGDFGYKLV